MINYGKVRSSFEPQPIKISATSVEVASNIIPYTEEFDNDRSISGFEYNFVVYEISEYIQMLKETNDKLEADLLDTQTALCDLYEAVMI